MNFEARSARRSQVLERIILASQVVAVLYLATHVLIAWSAYKEDGVAAAILTLILLGFGDLYWGVRWAYEDGASWQAGAALAAAVLCFLSWGFRPIFNRWAANFTIDMLEDFTGEIDRIAKDSEADKERDGPQETKKNPPEDML